MDNGFDKAQRAYDNMMPPEEPDYPECGECGGMCTLTDEQGNTERCHVCNGEGVIIPEGDDEPDEDDEDDCDDREFEPKPHPTDWL